MALLSCFLLLSCQNSKKGVYVCPPCDMDCDTLAFSTSGNCPHCKIALVQKETLAVQTDLKVNEVEFKSGSGVFLIESGSDNGKTILVHYHKPKRFNANSKVIFILPGAGRNGKDYRNAWVEPSEKYGVLVLSLEYSEEHYPGLRSYNLAGMIYDVDIQEETFQINTNAKEWIFDDFDSIYKIVHTTLHLKQDTYDMFGHSAGGQILHRLALFKPKNNADRILAANSGWYTVPVDSEPFPYGLQNFESQAHEINFDTKLTVFLGEKDDMNETRGHLRHSSIVDKQGLDRISRGNYFYYKSKEIAEKSEKEFNWRIEIVPNVGHDYKKMSIQAAEYLYKQ